MNHKGKPNSVDVINLIRGYDFSTTGLFTFKLTNDQALAELSAIVEEIIGSGCKECDFKGYVDTYASGDKYELPEKEPCEYCYDLQKLQRERAKSKGLLRKG